MTIYINHCESFFE